MPSMRDAVEIGQGRFARRGYRLAEVAIVPSRRTRDIDNVSLAWQIDAYRFELPLVGFPSDATMSPQTVALLGAAGGLGVLDAEGLWTRYDDPAPVLAQIAAAPGTGVGVLQRAYGEPVRDDLIRARIKQLRDAGGVVAVRVSPQHTLRLAPAILDAGVDVLVIQGTLVSAEHVSAPGAEPPLNLKTFIADLDVPVIVGGCTNYQTALHLMRTGAAGVIVGVGGGDDSSTTDRVLGIAVPMATAIVEAAAARRDYLDETGGRYVHVIAAGELATSGDIAKALACGADAVMLGQPLALAAEAPARGAWWHPSASHPKLPRGALVAAAPEWPLAALGEILRSAASTADGRTNLFGGLRRAIAKAGYSDLKEFQKVELVVSPR